MKKLHIRTLFGLFIMFLINGCGSSDNSALNNLSDIEYKIVKGRLDFEKNHNADINFDIDKQTDKALMMLLDAHVKIMYRISLQGKGVTKIKNVLFAEISSNKGIVFSKLLINKKDFYLDSVNNALYLLIEVPYIYLLDNELNTTLHLVMVTKGRKLQEKNIYLRYETRAMQENDEKYMSFKYVKSFDSDKVDNYIVSMIKKELENAELSHFENAYKIRHNKYFIGE